MAKSSVTIHGMAEVQAAIKKLPEKLKGKFMKQTLRAAARPLRKQARTLAPRGSKVHYKKSEGAEKEVERMPGNLKKSIAIITFRNKNKNRQSVFVGPRAGKKHKYDGWYGRFVEFGTKNMPAKPFMRPAYEQTKLQITKEISDKILARIKK